MRFSKLTSLLLILPFIYLKAQIELSIYTDKQTYDYGEPIQIICTLLNTSDSQVSFLHGSASSCQAEFVFNDKDSFRWAICLPMQVLINISPGGTRTYTWLIDPQKCGLPNLDGQQTIIGYFNGHDEVFTKDKDTTYITAPLFLGGELSVGYPIANDSVVAKFKDSFNVAVQYRIVYTNSIAEEWRFTGIQLDTLLNIINSDARFSYAEFIPDFTYQSITSVEDFESIPTSYNISNAYPNPFNPTTKFYVELPATQSITIDLYNSIGEKVKNIFTGLLKAGERSFFEINGNSLSSGVYYYVVKNKNIFKASKIVLMK